MTWTPQTIECLVCGSGLAFAPGQFSVRCTICDEDRPLPIRFAAELADSPVIPDGCEHDELPGRRRYGCMGSGCGASVSAPDRLDRCPCCGGELFEDKRATAVMRPHALLEFLVDESRARAELTTELARLRLASAATRFTRVYLPSMVMRCEVEGEYQGERGTEVRVNDTTQIRWEPVSGSFARPFDNVRASATPSPPDSLLRRLEPWDWAFCRPYDPGLLDAPAVHVTYGAEQVFERAFPDQREEYEQEACFEIGGDHQRVHDVHATMSDRRFRLVLLPVYVGMLEPGGHAFVINGRTGEVAVHGHDSATPDEDDVPLRPHGRWGDPRVLVALAVAAVVVIAFAVGMLF